MGIQEDITATLSTLPNLYSIYSYVKPNLASYQVMYNTLNSELSDINRKLQEFDRIEEVYDREFLDRKTNPPTIGLLSKYGLITTQDWVLAMFFLSYIVFCILFCITSILEVKYKIQASIFLFSITGFGGVIISSLIMRYA